MRADNRKNFYLTMHSYSNWHPNKIFSLLIYSCQRFKLWINVFEFSLMDIFQNLLCKYLSRNIKKKFFLKWSFGIGWFKSFHTELTTKNSTKKAFTSSKPTIVTSEKGENYPQSSEKRHWFHSAVFIVNFEHGSYIFLVFLLFTLNR